MSKGLRIAFQHAKPYLQGTVVAKVGEHQYLMGLQHRRTGAEGSLYWPPEKASALYFLQNDEGAATWPVTQEIVDELIREFNPPS